jgi:rRNA maturation endonuclease Nob1
VRNGLRKSFVTRKASRVEINDENKQLRDRKSSSSKSSVGSSLKPGHDVKSSTITLMRNKEQTPDSRNVARMTEAARKKKKDSNMSKTSDVRVKEKVFNSRKGAISNVSKSAPQEALKSKVRIRICINSRYVGYKIFF